MVVAFTAEVVVAAFVAELLKNNAWLLLMLLHFLWVVVTGVSDCMRLGGYQEV